MMENKIDLVDMKGDLLMMCNCFDDFCSAVLLMRYTSVLNEFYHVKKKVARCNWAHEIRGCANPRRLWLVARVAHYLEPESA